MASSTLLTRAKPNTVQWDDVTRYSTVTRSVSEEWRKHFPRLRFGLLPDCPLNGIRAKPATHKELQISAHGAQKSRCKALQPAPNDISRIVCKVWNHTVLHHPIRGGPESVGSIGRFLPPRIQDSHGLRKSIRSQSCRALTETSFGANNDTLLSFNRDSGRLQGPPHSGLVVPRNG
jgi:hypothetical protein